MAPTRSPEWQAHPSIAEQETSLQEALQLTPFEGSAVVAALARVIKATDTVRNESNGKVSARAASSFIVGHIVTAREVAESAPDPVYAQILQAQEKGWKGAVRATGATRARKPQAQPTSTASKAMSGAKANSNT